MRRIVPIVFVLIFAVTLSAQNFRLSLEPGYGFYDMGKLRIIQDVLIDAQPGFGIKAVESFPPFFNQSASILWYANPNFLIGFSTGFLSTGGRNSVSDYSGDYKLDILVKANSYALETEYDFILMPRLKYFLNLKAGKIYSTLKLKENLIVTNITVLNDSSSLKDSNLFVEPSTGILFFLNKSISISLGVGYLKDLRSKNENPTNWSGCQFKLGGAYSF